MTTTVLRVPGPDVVIVLTPRIIDTIVKCVTENPEFIDEYMDSKQLEADVIQLLELKDRL